MENLIFTNHRTGEQTVYNLTPVKGVIYPLWRDQYGDHWTKGILGFTTVDKYLKS